MTLIFRVLFILLMVALVRPACAEPLDNWHPVATQGTDTLKAAAFGAGSFVVVGTNAVILSSDDGITWTQRHYETGKELNDVTFCTNTFVAVGDNGAILASTNGTDWTPRNSESSANLDGVVCGNGLFVVVGGSGTLLTSPVSDSQQWTAQNSTVGKYLEAVNYGNGRFVAVGENGTIITSLNGLDWGAADSGTVTSLHDVAYGNGLWVAVGTDGVVRKSSNGTNWSDSPTGRTEWLRNVLFDGATFVVVGDSGLILSSPNASTWAQRTSNTTQLLWGLTGSDTAMVAAGMSGLILRSDLLHAYLNLSITGNGGGEVSVTPGNLVSSTSISKGVAYGSQLTLQAMPSDYPNFQGWSGGCSGFGACNLSMAVDRDVTAGFNIDWANAARIEGGNNYPLIMSAYGAAAASGSVIDAWGIIFPETLVFDQSKAVTLKGGFTSSYSQDLNRYTSVSGIQIINGSLTVERVAVK
jgi:hypothetical protein